ncbi:MAG: tRNA (adenosine(37)-N6)-dimethylallyltransferase MiaA [Nitrospiraceae bacterium]|nr:MAG: tRNA (adenosine(37)-N6)-dimethylallyltransferase MiaA [Nitrospiraceae bacterium]
MKKVIILLGPTAVGKTGVSILLAKELKSEIISADSMQIYRHMDIGTAKPSAKELKEIPHHLIDILSPDQSFSAGMFREKAVKIIDDLHGRGKVPVIAGGTGLYIRSLTRGLFEGPPADWTIRERLREEEQIHGREYMYKRLQSVDPEAAAKISSNDLRRIIRALEVCLKGDRTMSELHAVSTRPEEYDYIKIGLFRDRRELYSLIEKRVDSMIESGLMEETEKLMEMRPGRTAMQALGYREMMMVLQKEAGFDEAVRLLKKRTKMYAKRQFTWFKKEPDVAWVDITGIMDSRGIFQKVLNGVEILKKLIYS